MMAKAQIVKSGQNIKLVKADSGFILPANGLPVFQGEAWEDHVEAWKTERKETIAQNFRLGAIAASIEIKYGQRKLQEFATQVGENYRTILEYRRVYRRFENSSRLENLSWSVYQIAADADDPEKVIQTAADRHLSKRQTAKLVAGEEAEKYDLDAMMDLSLTSQQAALWEAFKRAARGLKYHLPFLRETLNDQIEILETMIQEEISQVPPPLRLRILRLFEESDGLASLEEISKRLLAKRPSEPSNRARTVPRDVCRGLLQRLVREGLIRETKLPRHDGARGAEQAIYKLTSDGRRMLEASQK